MLSISPLWILKHPSLLSTEISGVSSGCQQGGCLTCSDYNGCLSCKPRFFMHLERIGMKQIGVCMTSCPLGFYGTRSPERNTCTSKTPSVTLKRNSQLETSSWKIEIQREKKNLNTARRCFFFLLDLSIKSYIVRIYALQVIAYRVMWSDYFKWKSSITPGQLEL